MKLCGIVYWFRIGLLIIFINLLHPIISFSQNLPPVLNLGIPNQHAEVGSAFSYTIPSNAFKDENRDELSYQISGLPNGLLYDITTQEISGTPTTHGIKTISVEVNDGKTTSTTSFKIVVHQNTPSYAAFSASTQIGCNYRLVHFTNQSKGANTYSWNLGNGATGDKLNASRIYNEPGTYVVSLTINKGTPDESTYSETIKIYPLPKPQIGTINAPGCEPATIQLESSGNAVSVNSREIEGQTVGAINGGADAYHYWYFFEDHSAIYNTNPPSIQVNGFEGNIYNVLLEVTDENGCQSSTTKNKLFKVDDKPDASFSWDKSDKCSPSITQLFNESNVINAEIETSKWTVNNNIIDNTNDTIDFDFSNLGTGNHVVQLTTTTTEGCISNPFQDTIRFNSNNFSDFNTNALYCVGDTISFQAISSSTANEFNWDIDSDGSIEGNSKEFKYAYSNPGIYNVTLSTSFNDECIIARQQEIEIDEAIANFNSSIRFDCTNDNFPTRLTSTSRTHLGKNIQSHKWYLLENGIETLISEETTFIYTFENSGVKTIKLEVTSEDGCKSEIIKDITLILPSINFLISGTQAGCLSSAGITNFEGIFSNEYDAAQEYIWDFGDGNTGNGEETSHQFNTSGTFDITLRVKTITGCEFTLNKIGQIRLADKPIINAVKIDQDPEQCYSSNAKIDVEFSNGVEEITFTTTSETVTFDDISNADYSYNYEFPDTGSFDIEIITTQYGCSSDTYFLKDIKAKEPKALFSPSQNIFCDPPYNVTFSNHSSYTPGLATFVWDFGDGNTSTDIDSTTHSFLQEGNYTVSLTVNSGMCSDTYSEQINIFSFDDNAGVISAINKAGCVPLSPTFSQTISNRLSGNYNIKELLWDFNNDNIIDDTSDVSSNISFEYQKPGLYDVRLVVVGHEGCSYEFIEKSLIQVMGPIVNFTHTPNQVCTGTEVSFINQTTQPSFDSSTISEYNWSFGNESSSNLENPNYIFDRDTSYTVSLQVTDDQGCTNSLIKEDLINIIAFEPSFNPSDTIICLDKEITFSNTSTGSISTYNWDYDGDGNVDYSSSTNETVQHTYTSPGIYKAKLVAVSADGCSKPYEHQIRVINSTSDFAAQSTNIGCAPAFANFIPAADDDDVISYSWNFGDGNQSNERNPKNFYVTPGLYDVSLTINFIGGCSKKTEIKQYIQVDGAYGELVYDNSPGCAPNKIKLAVENISRATYIDWDFGTGEIQRDTIKSSSPSYTETFFTYDTLGYRTPKIILTDAICGEYVYQDETLGSIYTSYPPIVNFTVNEDSICKGVPIQFEDLSSSVDPNYNLDSWKWNFDSNENDSSLVQNPTYAYNAPGIYNPELIVFNQLGCSDTLKKKDFIFIYHNLSLSANFSVDDNLVCPNQEINIESQANPGANTITNWEWNFGNGYFNGSTKEKFSFHDSLAGQSIQIVHKVIDDKYCTDSTIRTVEINNLQAAFGYGPQPVYRGSLVDFENQSNSDFGTTITSWNWSFENGEPETSTVINPDQVEFGLIDNATEATLSVTNDNNCKSVVTIPINVLNNPPTIGSFTITLVENTTYLFNSTEFEDYFTSNDPFQNMDSIRIESAPFNAILNFNGSNYIIETPIPTTQIGNLELIPNSNWNGNTSFSWNGYDGENWGDLTNNISVVVLEEPDPPTISDLIFNIPEDSILKIGETDFATHVKSVLGSSYSFDSLTILSNLLPNVGTLLFNESPFTAPLLILENEFDNDAKVFKYTPTSGFNGSLSLEWNAHDGYNFALNPGRLIINYFNTPPVVEDIVINNLKQGVPVNIPNILFLDAYSDVDKYDTPNELFITNVPPQDQGILKHKNSNIDGNFASSFNENDGFKFFPDITFEGSTEITWGLSDGTDVSYARILLTFINTIPNNEQIIINGIEDIPLEFKTEDFEAGYIDEDVGDILEKIEITALPQIGQLLFNGSLITTPFEINRNQIGQLIYHPYSNWFGNDTLKYSVFDGTDWSITDTIAIINIGPVNDPPSPKSDFFAILEDEVLTGESVRINDSDIDDKQGILSYQVIGSDSLDAGINGIIDLNHNGYLNYTPTKDFYGNVEFIYTVCDDDNACAKDTVSISITPVNDAPVANIDTFIIYEDELSKTFNCLNNDIDVDGDDIYLNNINNDFTRNINTEYAEITWIPYGSFSVKLNEGLDSLEANQQIITVFDYSIRDTQSTTDSSKIVLVIQGRNDAPIANNDEYNFYEGFIIANSSDTKYSGILENDSDPENDIISLHTVNETTNKVLINSMGSFSWDENGTWEYLENIAATDSLQQGETITITYPYFNFDGTTQSEKLGDITLNIIGVNDAPIAESNFLEFSEDIDIININANQQEALLSNDSDIDNDNISVFDVSSIETGTTTSNIGEIQWFTDGSYNYTPNKDTVNQLAAGETITDVFNYTIIDEWDSTASAQLIITIFGENDKPFAIDDYLEVSEDTHITNVPKEDGLLNNDGDVDHDPIVVAVNGFGSRILDGEYGTLTWDSTGAYTYVTNWDKVNPLSKGEKVEDTFIYMVNDPSGETDFAKLHLTIIGQNDAPVANNYWTWLTEDEQRKTITIRDNGILSNDSDIDDGLNFEISNLNDSRFSPAKGNFGILSWRPDGSFNYILNESTDSLFENEVVIDSFDYVIMDAFDSIANAMFYIEITGNNDDPYSERDTLLLSENDQFFQPTWSLLDNDNDVDGDSIKVETFNNQTSSPSLTLLGEISWDSLGQITYNGYPHNTPTEGLDTLAFNDVLIDSIPYSIYDIHETKDQSFLYIKVKGENDSPVAKRDNNIISEITPSISSKANNNILANDFEIDRFDSIRLISVGGVTTDSIGGRYGYLQWNFDGSYTYFNKQIVTDSLSRFERVHDLFAYTIIDLQGATTTDTLDITIIGVNDKPLAENDTLVLTEDDVTLMLPAHQGILLNDSDIDGDFLTVDISPRDSLLILTGKYGVLSINKGGAINYTINPALDSLQTEEIIFDSFNYSIQDEHRQNANAKVIVKIVGVNDAPIAHNDRLTISEDLDTLFAPIYDTNALLTHDIDIDGDELEVILINSSNTTTISGVYGELTWHSDGSYSYALFNEITNSLSLGDSVHDVFNYVISDQQNSLDSAQLIIQIYGENDAPVAQRNYYETFDIAQIKITTDSTNDILDNDYDVDGDNNIISRINDSTNDTIQGQYGMLIWQPDGSFLYLPDSANAVSLRPYEISTDEFEYTISDDLNATDTSLITFNIIGINNPPQAYNDSILMFEDDLVGKLTNGALFNDTDPDRDTLKITRIENSTNGVLSGLYGEIFWESNGEIVYTPNREIIDQLGPGQNIIEEYEYTVTDDQNIESKANLIIYIIGENDKVTANTDYAIVEEDDYVLIDVLKNDIDPDFQFKGVWAKPPVTIVKSPSNGQGYVNTFNGTISYFPNENFFGKDSLIYKVTDRENSFDTSWVYIEVTPINDPPVATHLILKTDKNIPVSFNIFNQVEDIDDGIKPNSYNLVSEHTNIEKTTDSIYTYIPKEDTVGRDEFIYSLSDFEGQQAFVIVTVLIPDDGDGAQDDYVTISENRTIQIDILQNDTINGFRANPLSVDILIYAKNGIASYNLADHYIEYQPHENFNGYDSLTYLVESDSGIWDYATVYITVEPVNSQIITNDDAVTTFVNRSKEIQILINDYDIDNGIDFGSVVLTQPVLGEVYYDSISGFVTYTPEKDSLGEVNFTYTVCDLDSVNASCASADVTILIKGKNDGVFAENDSTQTEENITLFIDTPHPTSNDLNVEIETFTVITNPQHGSYTLDETTKVIEYTPNQNYFGPDWITYKVCDSNGNCDFAEINIWVNEVNTPPVANDDDFVVTKNQQKRLSILSNDFDFDGVLDWSSLKLTSNPEKGSFIVDQNTGTILYTPTTNADVDYFSYEICDNDELCSTANVRVIVDLGSTILYEQVLYEDIPDTFALAPVLEKYNIIFNIQDIFEVVTPNKGTWESISNSQIIYTPLQDSTGYDYYNLILFAANGDSVDLRISVSILPVNDAPVAVYDTITWANDLDSLNVNFNQILHNDYDVDGDSILLSEFVLDHGDSLHISFNNDSTITIQADTILWCDSWFIYEIKDPSGSVGIGEVLIIPELDGIIANTDSTSADENGGNITIDVIVNDLYKDNQYCTIDTIIITTEPQQGLSISTENNQVEYRPNDHYYGPDSLEYTLIDMWGQQASAWVQIDVIQKNKAPIAEPDVITSEFGQSIIIRILDNDADQDPYPYGSIDTVMTSILIEPNIGSLEFIADSGYFIYTPEEFSCEADEFTYTIYDNEGDSDSAVVIINLPNDVYLAAITDTIKTWPGIPVEFNVLENDEGYFLPFISDYYQPEQGILEQTGDSTFVFQPNMDFMGMDSTTYTIESPCTNIAIGNIYFMIEELRVPEIITPNDDRKNDVLIIDGIEYFPESLLQIYNRYGHMVYQSKGYQNDWGGYSNQGSFGGDKPLPSATYYYTLTYNNGQNRQKGFIYLFR